MRMSFDLRTQAQIPGQAGNDVREGAGNVEWKDQSQRMLNAIEPGSVVQLHRQQKTSETVVVLRGRVVEEYYDDAGVLVESFVLGDCHVADAPRNDVLDFAPRNDVPVACALNIPAGQWHTLRALESGTVILEMKDGAYEPIGPAEDVMER